MGKSELEKECERLDETDAGVPTGASHVPKKKDQPKRLATEAQISLIQQLYEEMGYKERRENMELESMTREQASEHVHFLKEMKVRDQAQRSNNQRVKGFDKISHAMLFKLMWCEEEREYYAHRAREFGNVSAMCELYDGFKASEAGVKAHVEEGGQK